MGSDGGLCWAWLPSGAGCENRAVLPPSVVRGAGELDFKQREIEHAVD